MDVRAPSELGLVLNKLDEMSGHLSKLDSLDTKIDVHIAESAAVNKCVDDLSKTVYGVNKDDGMVTKVNTLDVRQNIVYGVLGTIGIACVGLLVWLVQNAMNVATVLKAVGR